SWAELATVDNVAVTDIYPVTGRTGAVYALTEASRTPLALGDAPAVDAAVVTAPVAEETGIDLLAILAWTLAGLAAIGLGIIVGLDISRRRALPRTETGALATEP